jgi:1-acyl-sn-glycerol-3-phosphate acyltransferase
MKSFKAGLGMLIAGTSVPVVPCYLSGCFEALRPETKWPRRLPISLNIGAPMCFADVGEDREGWVHIAKATEAAVKRLAPIAELPA